MEVQWLGAQVDGGVQDSFLRAGPKMQSLIDKKMFILQIH